MEQTLGSAWEPAPNPLRQDPGNEAGHRYGGGLPHFLDKEKRGNLSGYSAKDVVSCVAKEGYTMVGEDIKVKPPRCQGRECYKENTARELMRVGRRKL